VGFCKGSFVNNYILRTCHVLLEIHKSVKKWQKSENFVKNFKKMSKKACQKRGYVYNIG
jgi:hypothetical protein